MATKDYYETRRGRPVDQKWSNPGYANPFFLVALDVCSPKAPSFLPSKKALATIVVMRSAVSPSTASIARRMRS